jgi:predicted aspartyl protease
MGNFYVRALLTGPTGASEDLDFLVDTGATFLAVPRFLAERLALVPTRTVSIQIAGGMRQRWPIAEVRLTLGDDTVVTPCLILPDGAPLLGAVALETLLLAVDPVARRLVPTDGLAMATRGLVLSA